MSKTTRKTTANSGPLGPWMPRRAEVVTITPKVAAEILNSHNTRNRPINNASVEYIKQALLGGTWDQDNGETVIFSNEGVLLDGQHRLWGCVESNKPLKTLVAFGRDPQAFLTIDRGRNRSAANDFAIDGEENCNALVACLQVVKSYLDGTRGNSVLAGKFSYKILKDVLCKHPGIRDSVKFASHNKHKISCHPRIIAAVHYLSSIDAAPNTILKRDEFYRRLIDGANLAAGDPVLVLRDKLFSMNHSTDARVRKGMGDLTSLYLLHSVVKCWNAYASGHRLNKIQLVYANKERTILSHLPDIKTSSRKPALSVENDSMETYA